MKSKEEMKRYAKTLLLLTGLSMVVHLLLLDTVEDFWLRCLIVCVAVSPVAFYLLFKKETNVQNGIPAKPNGVD